MICKGVLVEDGSILLPYLQLCRVITHNNLGIPKIELLLLSIKIFLSSLEIAAIWTWYGYSNKSKILHAACNKSVMTTIFEMPGTLVAWLMLYLITNSSVSDNMTFTAWWIILMTSLLWIWMWAMNMEMLFLILVSMITRAIEESSEEEIVKLFSNSKQALKDSLLLFLKEWKEKWLTKMSTILEPGENSLLKGSNAGKTSLNLSSMSTTKPLIFALWHGMRELNDNWWGSALKRGLALSSNLRI